MGIPGFFCREDCGCSPQVSARGVSLTRVSIPSSLNAFLDLVCSWQQGLAARSSPALLITLMTLRIFSPLLLAACTSFAFSQSAKASELLPPGCANAASQEGATGNRSTDRSYRTGVAIGTSLVASSWARSGQCTEVEEFEALVEGVLERFTPAPGASERMVCRYTGVFDGILTTLDALVAQCSARCEEGGSIVGRFAARVYCDLSIALDGLRSSTRFIRPDVRICGLSFEVGCDSTFVRVTRGYVNRNGVSCLSYTEGEHFDVWSQTLNNQCIFNLPPAHERSFSADTPHTVL